MALAHVPDVGRYGSVTLDGDFVRGFNEKGGTGPGYINAGCYFLDGTALSALPGNRSFSFETEILAPLAAAAKVVGLPDTSAFIDIGVPEDYLRAQEVFGGC